MGFDGKIARRSAYGNGRMHRAAMMRPPAPAVGRWAYVAAFLPACPRVPSSRRLAPRRFGDSQGPVHDPVLELIVGHVLLARLDPSAHRDPGRVDGFGIA